jgi:hypothetical protein
MGLLLYVATMMDNVLIPCFLGSFLSIAVFASIVNAFEPAWHAPRSVPAVTVRTTRENSEDLPFTIL